MNIKEYEELLQPSQHQQYEQYYTVNEIADKWERDVATEPDKVFTKTFMNYLKLNCCVHGELQVLNGSYRNGIIYRPFRCFDCSRQVAGDELSMVKKI